MSEKLGERLRKIRESKGLSLDGLAEKSNIHRDHIGRIERNEQSNPRQDTIECLAKALEVSPSELLYGKFGQGLSKLQDLIKGPELKEIPLLSGTVSASDFSHAFDDWEGETIAVPFKSLKNKVAWKVSGRSMEPEIGDGDIIIIDTTVHSDGDLVIGRNDDGVTVKELKVFKDGSIELRPLNPEFKTLRFNSDHDKRLEILGVVVGHYKDLTKRRRKR